MNPAFSAFAALIRRDMILAYRNHHELANPLAFFLMFASIFPLAINPEPVFLQKMAPGIVWIAALIASLLSLENLFRSDYDDGSIEQWVLSPHPLALLVLAKVVAHWCMSGLPMLLLAPLMGLLLQMPTASITIMEMTLLLGTPSLSLIGAIGVALTVGLKRGGMLLGLLILPLYIPVLIFATSAITAAASGLPVSGQLYFLAAMSLLGVSLAPWAIASALRISVS